MGERTKILWTDATWSPVTGCSMVSPGCTNCYAQALSLRRKWSAQPWTAPNAAENVRLHPDRLDQPRRWRRPHRIFVCSMGDLFHERVPDEFIAKVFAVMGIVPRHTFQVLTKRAERLRALVGSSRFRLAVSEAAFDMAGATVVREGVESRYEPLADAPWPLPNVWLGVSVEDQRRADERIPLLIETPAAVRFVSLEPLLGPVDLGLLGTMPREISPHYAPVAERLHWVIVGGESGPGYREMRLEWLESIVAQCRAAHVPIFVKQDSGPRPGRQGRIPDALWALKAWPA